jgi:adenine-specific DNA-methyltransferase
MTVKDQEIFKLQKEIERLKKSVKKQRYGLVWMNVSEAFEDDVENKLPVLKEVPNLAIKTDDGKPQHILIQGDNYHALTCLNYTHKEKIDVIYIDPPYNTGSDGFRYKDKRIISKFPDGTEVPKDHPFRHGYWLSFMEKRLELSKSLLKKNGVIFISIDDNELYQLKLLCDNIFGEQNFVANFVRKSKAGAGHDSGKVAIEFDYMLCYAKDYSALSFNKEKLDVDNDSKYRYSDKFVDFRGKYYLRDLDYKGNYNETGDYPIVTPDKTKIWAGGKKGKPNTWRWSKKKFEWGVENDFIVFKKVKDNWKVYIKQYQYVDNENKKRERIIPYRALIDFSNSAGSQELKKKLNQDIFNYPKPLGLIDFICDLSLGEKGIFLDFFAGSGTSGEAIIRSNKKNKRQFILCTNNESEICKKVCYPRIKNSIKEYGNSLKFYETLFIGKNNILNVNDEDKVELAHNAGELLAIAENTLELVKKTKYYQLFEDNLKKKYTAVYFREELDQFNKFIEAVKKLKKDTIVYVFSWGQDEFIEDFEYLKNVTIKTIPVPILEIYKNIYNLIN